MHLRCWSHRAGLRSFRPCQANKLEDVAALATFPPFFVAVGPGRRMTEGGSCFGQLAKAGLAERPTLKSVDVSCSSDAFLTLFFLY